MEVDIRFCQSLFNQSQARILVGGTTTLQVTLNTTAAKKTVRVFVTIEMYGKYNV